MEFSSYLTGFTDGEGSFSISFSKRAKFSLGIEVRPSFSISQNKRSLEILNKIHSFFKVGSIRYSRSDQTYKYEVRSLSDLSLKIIPHFQNFPLMTNKHKDFLLFVEVVKLIRANQHLNKQGLEKIIDLACQMNESGKRKYKREQLLKLLAR